VLSESDDVDTPQMTQAELDAAVGEAHALRKRTAAHATAPRGQARHPRRHRLDRARHVPRRRGARLMKARGTVFIPTLMAHQGLRERIARGAAMQPTVLAKARAPSPPPRPPSAARSPAA
jgi:hypothetical protein